MVKVYAAGDWGPDPSQTAATACYAGAGVMLGLGDYSYESGTNDKAWFAKMGCLSGKFVGALGNHGVADAKNLLPNLLAKDPYSSLSSALFW